MELPFYGLRPIQVQGFSEKNAGTWTQSKRRLRGITRAMAHCRAVRGTSHRRRFEKMDYSPRAAASADSGTALDGEAGRRNGLRSQSLPGRDRQQIKKEGDYQSEDFLVTLNFALDGEAGRLFYPLEEVIDAGAGDGHFEGRGGVGADLQAAAAGACDAADGTHRDYATT